jgi:hypothetical protein
MALHIAAMKKQISVFNQVNLYPMGIVHMAVGSIKKSFHRFQIKLEQSWL